MNDAGIDFPSASAFSLPAHATMPECAAAWPFPVQCVPDDGAERISGVACNIDLLSGAKYAGTLVSFDPRKCNLSFIAADAASVVHHPFDQLLCLRLPLAVAIQRPQQRIAPANHTPVTLPFILKLRDGAIISGETVGSVEDDAGLYLFVPKDDNAVERHFYPRGALASHQVGELLGEILLNSRRVSRHDIDNALKEQQHNRGQRLGELLAKNHVITREDLAIALKRQGNMPVMRLGEALLQMNFITQEQLDTALAEQKNDRKRPLGQLLVNARAIDEQQLKQALAEKLGIPFVELDTFPVEFDAISRIGEDIARKHCAMPLYVEHGAVVVALSDPLSAQAIDALRFHSQMRIATVMAAKEDIQRAILRCYGPAVSATTFWDAAPMEAKTAPVPAPTNNAQEKSRTEELVTQLNLSMTQPVEVVEPQVNESDNNLVKLVNKIMIDASQQHATDIHIENYPDKQDTCVRFRRDGALYDYLHIPHRFRSAIVSRVKIMSGLDISEKRRPQDGKLEFAIPGEAKIELRVATIPTANGLEDIVMRLLAGATLRSLEHIGMDERMSAELKRLVAKPYGMILVCGPTGSGKTTTLHSLLGQINTRERKIWTAEDPVEITHPGLRQVQVHSKIGWTFAATLRAFLRGDPDVIMVGEMRDIETARIAMEASLTGHLVLSTLHTNSAVDSVVRLLDMGLDPFNFADALLGVIAQRLARKVCETCGTLEVAQDDELEALAQEYCADTDGATGPVIAAWKARHDGKIMLRRPNGCDTCGQTGYRGRIGLYELFVVDRAARRLMQKRGAMEELLGAARAAGMATLKQNGIDRIIDGHTDLKQVRAVCG